MYGIAHLSVIPIRGEPNERSEMTSQLLFGETYELIETIENEQWRRIKTTYDNYDGWVSISQYHWISRQAYNNHSMSKNWLLNKYCLARHSQYELLLSFGSLLPDAAMGSFLFEEQVFKTGNIQTGTLLPDEETLQNITSRWIGTPYLWGGRSVFGVDCSGFVQSIYRVMGIHLPRDAKDQATHGTEISNPANTEPGDLLFFQNAEGKVVHVAIALSDNLVIHASGEVRTDTFDEKGIYRKDLGRYTHSLANIKRMF